MPNAKIPTGKTYSIIPNTPPSISFNFIPINPDLVYIKTPNKMLNIINITIVKSFFVAVFFF